MCWMRAAFNTSKFMFLIEIIRIVFSGAESEWENGGVGGGGGGGGRITWYWDHGRCL